MKAYTFINSYIYGIQVGIQAGHSIVELMNEFGSTREVQMWANKYKTFAWLDGGNDINMKELLSIVEDSGVPVMPFYEEGMGNLLTSFTLVLTNEQLELADNIRKLKLNKYTSHNGIKLAYPDWTEYDLDILHSEGLLDLLILIAGSRSKQL